MTSEKQTPFRAHCTAVITALLLLNCPVPAQNFSFAFLSDTHIGVKNADEDLRKSVQDINGDTALKFVIISGDITELGTDEELLQAKEILSRLNKPLYSITGNHDGNWSPTGGNTFRKLLGAGRFSFVYNGYLFIGTNSGPNMLHKSPGQVPREDIFWMASVLNQPTNKGFPVVYVNHYPQDAAQRNWYEAIDLLKQNNIQLILVGHGHLNGQYNFEGIPGIMGRSNMRSADSVVGYNVVRFIKGEAVFEEKKPLTGTMKQWAGTLLFNHHFKNDTATYARPSYAINGQYTTIKTRWQYRDDYDLGTGTVIYKQLAIATNTGGEIFALDIATGKKAWSFFTKEKIYSTPALSGNYLVVPSTDGFIYCLNAANGKLSWKVNTGTAIVAQPLVQYNIIYIGSSDGHFRAMNANNGTTVWNFAGVKDFVSGKPLLYGGHIFFGSWGGEFYALDAATGTLAWKWVDTSGNRMYAPAGCTPVAVKGKVLMVAPDGFMTSFDAGTGAVLWRQKRNDVKVRESMGLSADSLQVYVKTTDGKLVSISTVAPSMQTNWSVTLQWGYDLCAVPPLERDGIVYVPSDSGVIAAAGTKSDTLLWQYKVSNSLVNSIIPVNRQTVIVTTVDGKITSLQINEIHE